MISFKDALGREWPLEINVLAIRRVRQGAKIDLLKAVDGTLQESLADVIVLADVLASLLEEEIKKPGITADQLVSAIRGDAIEGATEALMEAIAEFLPTKQGTILRQMNAKAREAANAATDELSSLLAQMDVKQIIEREPSLNASQAPESPAPTSAE